MNLSPHFTLAEFTDSDTAARRGIDNGLPASLMPNAMGTAGMLERIRTMLCELAGREVPIIITSGYRCPALNAAIGSNPTSDHPRAMAADWRAPAFGTPYAICKALAPHIDSLAVGQMIHEFGNWVHTSTREPALQRNRIITITTRGITRGVGLGASPPRREKPAPPKPLPVDSAVEVKAPAS
jgi:zinc D-Ala-D-Ala carboxypeptidase